MALFKSLVYNQASNFTPLDYYQGSLVLRNQASVKPVYCSGSY